MQLYKTQVLAAGLILATAVMGVSVNSASAARLVINTAAASYGKTYNTSTPDTLPAVVTADIQPALKIKEATALDLWLDRLAEIESRGREHLKILDVNGKFSYGCLQFQEWTFKNYGTKYGLLKNVADWEGKIYDCSLQKLIAKKMLRDDYVLWQSWYTSVVERDLGLPPRS